MNEANKNSKLPMDNAQAPQSSERRTLLKAMGFGAAALIGATGMYPMTADAASPPTFTSNKAVAANLELKQLDTSKLRQLTLVKRAPGSTPITKMGLDSKGIAMLTPAARQLTKSDLEALGSGRVSGKLEKLTVDDINSIKGAFGKGYNPGDVAAISCCCCTPCCCAAAVTDARPNAA